MDFDEDLLLNEISRYDGRSAPTGLLSKYLLSVAYTGKTVVTWKQAKPFFVALCDREMRRVYELTSSSCFAPIPNAENVTYEMMRARILNQFGRFGNAPFTIQRIAELLAEPLEQYSRADKFMRGLERALLVVTQVDPAGNRILHDPPFPGEPEDVASSPATPMTPKFDSFTVPQSPHAVSKSTPSANGTNGASGDQHVSTPAAIDRDREPPSSPDYTTRFVSSALDAIPKVEAKVDTEAEHPVNDWPVSQESDSKPDSENLPEVQSRRSESEDDLKEKTETVLERTDSAGFEMDTSEVECDVSVAPLDTAMALDKCGDSNSEDFMDTQACSDSPSNRSRKRSSDVDSRNQSDSEVLHAHEDSTPTKQRRLDDSQESLSSQELLASQEPQLSPHSQESHETHETHEAQHTEESRPTQETQLTQETQETQDAPETEDTRQTQETQETPQETPQETQETPLETPLEKPTEGNE